MRPAKSDASSPFWRTRELDEWAIFDDSNEAELSSGEVGLFPAPGRTMRRPTGYGRSAWAVDAIRFAIEELPPEHLLATS
jgi:hypothetical protein